MRLPHLAPAYLRNDMSHEQTKMLAIDEPCVALSPQSVAQNENFYTLCVAVHIFVAGNRRNFKFDMRIAHKEISTAYTVSK